LKERSISFETKSERETILLGKKLGRLLAEGDVVALVGELGSGKTCFTKGLAKGLGVAEDIIVTSPSFALVNEYAGRCSLFHIDAYRLDTRDEFLSAGLDEYFYAGGVVAMEWANRCPEDLPPQRVKVEFEIIEDKYRRIKFTAVDAGAVEKIEKLAGNCFI
jgi:tRNA threonylcarbamoyladenosine biosynthesis protein TsaE